MHFTPNTFEEMEKAKSMYAKFKSGTRAPGGL